MAVSNLCPDREILGIFVRMASGSNFFTLKICPDRRKIAPKIWACLGVALHVPASPYRYPFTITLHGGTLCSLELAFPSGLAIKTTWSCPNGIWETPIFFRPKCPDGHPGSSPIFGGLLRRPTGRDTGTTRA
jgi:hypothetical protein